MEKFLVERIADRGVLGNQFFAERGVVSRLFQRISELAALLVFEAVSLARSPDENVERILRRRAAVLIQSRPGLVRHIQPSPIFRSAIFLR